MYQSFENISNIMIIHVYKSINQPLEPDHVLTHTITNVFVCIYSISQEYM